MLNTSFELSLYIFTVRGCHGAYFLLQHLSMSILKLYLLFIILKQRQCQPHLAETAKASVEGICLKIYHLSAEYARKIREKQSVLLKENGIQVSVYLT